MQVVKTYNYLDGCERYKKYTVYLNHYQFMCLYSLLKLMCVPFPTDSTDGEKLESERYHLLSQLPAVEVRALECILDEMSKAL